MGSMLPTATFGTVFDFIPAVRPLAPPAHGFAAGSARFGGQAGFIALETTLHWRFPSSCTNSNLRSSCSFGPSAEASTSALRWSPNSAVQGDLAVLAEADILSDERQQAILTICSIFNACSSNVRKWPSVNPAKRPTTAYQPQAATASTANAKATTSGETKYEQCLAHPTAPPARAPCNVLAAYPSRDHPDALRSHR